MKKIFIITKDIGWHQEKQKYGSVYVGTAGPGEPFQDGISCYVKLADDARYIFFESENYQTEQEQIGGIRPVFLLRGDLTIKGGDGKSEETAYMFN